MDKLRLLFVSSRPLSWVNTAFPFAAGYLMLGGGWTLLLIVGTVFFLIPYNLLMYGVNDVFDYESDMKNPRKGGVEGAVTPKEQHRFILMTAVWLAVPFVAFLLISGTAWSSFVLLWVLFFVVAYSFKGLRFKERPLIDSVTSSLHFVGPLLFSYALLDPPVAAWLVAMAFFMWGMASHAFGAVQDILPDRSARIGSIATLLGAQRTVWFAFLVYLTSAGLLLKYGSFQFIIAGLCVLLYAANVAPYLTLTDNKSEEANRGWRRFLALNYIVGAVVTMLCLSVYA